MVEKDPLSKSSLSPKILRNLTWRQKTMYSRVGTKIQKKLNEFTLKVVKSS